MEILFSLYKGKVQGKFLGPTPESPNRHMYYIEGKRKTGVTTFLNIKDKSNALMIWQGETIAKHLFDCLKQGQEINHEVIVKAIFAPSEAKTKAADLGTLIHDWIERYIKHKIAPKKNPMPEMPEDQNAVTGVTSFLEWESTHKVKYLWSEKVLYSLKHDYIGKGDFGAVVDGITCLCDIKSSNGIYNSVCAQTAAYAEADREESGIKYQGRWAIRLAKETPDEYQVRMDLKNEIKSLLGKNEKDIEPYQVFEAKFLDNEKGNMKRDFEGFMSHMNLCKWDKLTDFWANKQK
jgi:hypothetical protein